MEDNKKYYLLWTRALVHSLGNISTIRGAWSGRLNSVCIFDVIEQPVYNMLDVNICVNVSCYIPGSHIDIILHCIINGEKNRTLFRAWYSQSLACRCVLSAYTYSTHSYILTYTECIHGGWGVRTSLVFSLSRVLYTIAHVLYRLASRSYKIVIPILQAPMEELSSQKIYSHYYQSLRGLRWTHFFFSSHCLFFCFSLYVYVLLLLFFFVVYA